MKIKEFDEKVRIGSQISFNGMVYVVVDIDRRTHEAIVGKAAIRIRCSEFELYTGGKVAPCKYNDPPVKLGRPGKPVVAVFQNGRREVFTSLSKASEVLGISRHTIKRDLRGENTQVVGIRFEW